MHLSLTVLLALGGFLLLAALRRNVRSQGPLLELVYQAHILSGVHACASWQTGICLCKLADSQFVVMSVYI